MAKDKWKKIVVIKARLFKNQSGKCFYCNCKFQSPEQMALDHVEARCLGGRNCLENYVMTCKRCNSSKGGKTLHGWALSCKEKMAVAYEEYRYRSTVLNKILKIT
jgi:5-methylcytosine-specific restriction endonuclease McrA